MGPDSTGHGKNVKDHLMGLPRRIQDPAEGQLRLSVDQSRDNTRLYATMLGWEKGQKEITITSLSADSSDLKELQAVELINGAARKYVKVNF